MLKLVIFDFDGTIADTIPICLSAFREAFQRVTGRHYSDADIFAMFGPNEEGIVRRQEPERWRECLEAFYEAYDRGHDDMGAVFDGIGETIARLRARGVRVALVTGKGAGSASISMRRLGMEGLFDWVRTGSPEGDVKDVLIPEVVAGAGVNQREAAYVGDVPGDMRSARQSGVMGLGAAWSGTSTHEALAEAGAHEVFGSVEAFSEWILRFSGQPEAE